MLIVGMKNNKHKGVFFKFSSFSLVNESLINNFKKQVEFEFDYLDVESIYPRRSFKNIIYTFIFFIQDIVLLKRSFRGLLIHSPLYFNIIKRRSSDLIKKNKYGFTFQTQSLWDSSCQGVPHFVYTDHTELAYLRYPGLNRKVYPEKWILKEKQIYQNASMIFTTSNFSKKSIVEDYNIDESKVKVVYSGININIPPKIPTKINKSQNILFIGVQWERKGGPFLLEAFKTLKQRNKNITLTVIGCNPQIDFPGVEVVGFLDKTEMYKYFPKAQIFCMPSVAEPSAVALVEAYAFGLPVVATNVGGSPDRVIDSVTGYLVDYGNVEQLIEKLTYLLNNPPICRQFAENGYHLLNEKFTWDIVTKKVLNHIYNRLN